MQESHFRTFLGLFPGVPERGWPSYNLLGSDQNVHTNKISKTIHIVQNQMQQTCHWVSIPYKAKPKKSITNKTRLTRQSFAEHSAKRFVLVLRFLSGDGSATSEVRGCSRFFFSVFSRRSCSLFLSFSLSSFRILQRLHTWWSWASDLAITYLHTQEIHSAEFAVLCVVWRPNLPCCVTVSHKLLKL